MLTRSIAEYATSTSFHSIPTDVVERAKLVIFDELACACFGRRSVGGDLTARYAVSVGGPGDSRILGTGMRVPAPFAALANGTAGHGEEVDGAHVVGGHPGATVVPAAMAMSERRRASGADLINAVVLGYDVGTRMVEACGGVFVAKQRRHLHSDFLYAVGAAVASGRLLALDATQQCHAMALVTFQANGLCALFQERRHISKSFSAGQYAFAGVSAALMAAVGLEGSDDIVGATHGLLDAWGIEQGSQVVTRGLGEEYTIMGANFKFVNAGYPIHATVEAATEVVRSHRIAVGAIVGVHVGMPANSLRVVDNREMHSICVQDMLAAALVRGGLSLRDVPFPEILGDPAFTSMRARITTGVDPDLERDMPNGRGANVTITTTGSQFAHRVDWPKGHSRRGGVTWEDLAEKWHEGLPGYDIERALGLARHLEDVDDATVLAEAFTS